MAPGAGRGGGLLLAVTQTESELARELECIEIWGWLRAAAVPKEVFFKGKLRYPMQGRCGYSSQANKEGRLWA